MKNLQNASIKRKEINVLNEYLIYIREKKIVFKLHKREIILSKCRENKTRWLLESRPLGPRLDSSEEKHRQEPSLDPHL